MWLYEIHEWVILNREIVKIFYGLIIGIICAAIVSKSDKLFRLSDYQGIRYFRNAFFFYGIAFIIRYIFGSCLLPFVFLDRYHIIMPVFEYFLVMAGFFLFYSLLWKRIEYRGYSFSSLFNAKIAVFYLMSLIIALLDYLWHTFVLMFSSQIFLFICMSILAYTNCLNKPRTSFPKLYFIAMVLGLIAWLLNLVAGLWLSWNRGILINIYIMNIVVFLMFLYGVISAIKK